jgi:hypothetical protein
MLQAQLMKVFLAVGLSLGHLNGIFLLVSRDRILIISDF